eukprot:CAMPEP_0119409494 /NCGR_PEP_ID=MMETSP1335-20130426/2780_1 /TAXON_ID=259385 /ORGANISM="Chrysoculter rhomboideus, Strain RCC1486" /LENGTH=41 /DNA_ID= /DNA_START= /DNA_END= /DNA_ORIENTATION=
MVVAFPSAVVMRNTPQHWLMKSILRPSSVGFSTSPMKPDMI